MMTRSLRLNLKLAYQLTQRMLICPSKCRPLKVLRPVRTAAFCHHPPITVYLHQNQIVVERVSMAKVAASLTGCSELPVVDVTGRQGCVHLHVGVGAGCSAPGRSRRHYAPVLRAAVVRKNSCQAAVVGLATF